MSECTREKLDAMTVVQAEGYTRCLAQAGFMTNLERHEYLKQRDPAYGKRARGGYVDKWA
jgi:hypothetical protein